MAGAAGVGGVKEDIYIKGEAHIFFARSVGCNSGSMAAHIASRSDRSIRAPTQVLARGDSVCGAETALFGIRKLKGIHGAGVNLNGAVQWRLSVLSNLYKADDVYTFWGKTDFTFGELLP